MGGVGVQNATTFRCFGVRSSEPASHYQRDQNESKARQVERACWCVGYMSAVPGASRCSGVRWSSFEEVPREQQSVHARSSASEWLAGGTHAFTSVAARGAEAAFYRLNMALLVNLHGAFHEMTQYATDGMEILNKRLSAIATGVRLHAHERGSRGLASDCVDKTQVICLHAGKVATRAVEHAGRLAVVPFRLLGRPWEQQGEDSSE